MRSKGAKRLVSVYYVSRTLCPWSSPAWLVTRVKGHFAPQARFINMIVIVSDPSKKFRLLLLGILHPRRRDKSSVCYHAESSTLISANAFVFPFVIILVLNDVPFQKGILLACHWNSHFWLWRRRRKASQLIRNMTSIAKFSSVPTNKATTSLW
jgi:hypothetical protein